MKMEEALQSNRHTPKNSCVVEHTMMAASKKFAFDTAARC